MAPAAWRSVDFISDLHLEADAPATVAAWQHYLLHTQADAVFMLGDVFEVWVGDDAASPGTLAAQCSQIMAQAAQRTALYFMPGNRDFLLGSDYLARSRAQLLSDPTVLEFADQRWLLSHGDALCLGDTDYQQFRAQVRSSAWQQQFLARPLAERQTIARQLRQHSEARKRHSQPGNYADADPHTACAWLQAGRASVLIHGHTHQPADHDLPQGLRRCVLSDWDAAAQPPRLQVLRGTAQGLCRLVADLA
jgi:UDP-2,3-diacylglucosamine hydrolase